MNDMPSPLKINLCLLKVRVKIAFLIFTDVKKKKLISSLSLFGF